MITYTNDDIDRIIDAAADRAAKAANQSVAEALPSFRAEMDDIAEKAADRAVTKALPMLRAEIFQASEAAADRAVTKALPMLKTHINQASETAANRAVTNALPQFRTEMAAMFEDFEHRHQQTYEAIDFIKQQVTKIPAMEQDIAELKSDMKAVKLVLTDTNKDVAYLMSVAHSH